MTFSKATILFLAFLSIFFAVFTATAQNASVESVDQPSEVPEGEIVTGGPSAPEAVTSSEPPIEPQQGAGITTEQPATGQETGVNQDEATQELVAENDEKTDTKTELESAPETQSTPEQVDEKTDADIIPVPEPTPAVPPVSEPLIVEVASVTPSVADNETNTVPVAIEQEYLASIAGNDTASFSDPAPAATEENKTVEVSTSENVSGPNTGTNENNTLVQPGDSTETGIFTSDADAPVIGNGTQALMLATEEPPKLLNASAELIAEGTYVGSYGNVTLVVEVNETSGNFDTLNLTVKEAATVIGDYNTVTLKVVYRVKAITLNLNQTRSVTFVGKGNQEFFVEVYEIEAETKNITDKRLVYVIKPNKPGAVINSSGGDFSGNGVVWGIKPLSPTSKPIQYITEVAMLNGAWQVEIFNSGNSELNLTDARIEYGHIKKIVLANLDQNIDPGEATVVGCDGKMPKRAETLCLINNEGEVLSSVRINPRGWQDVADEHNVPRENVSWQYNPKLEQWGWGPATLSKPNTWYDWFIPEDKLPKLGEEMFQQFAAENHFMSAAAL